MPSKHLLSLRPNRVFPSFGDQTSEYLCNIHPTRKSILELLQRNDAKSKSVLIALSRGSLARRCRVERLEDLLHCNAQRHLLNQSMTNEGPEEYTCRTAAPSEDTCGTRTHQRGCPECTRKCHALAHCSRPCTY